LEHKRLPLFLTLVLLFTLPNQNIGRFFSSSLKQVQLLLSGPPGIWRPTGVVAQKLESVREQPGQLYVFYNLSMLAHNTHYKIIAPTKWCYVHFWHQLPPETWDPNLEIFNSIIQGLEKYKTRFILDYSKTNAFSRVAALDLWQQYLGKNYKFVANAEQGGQLFERVLP
jgi:hypothetical protein